MKQFSVYTFILITSVFSQGINLDAFLLDKIQNEILNIQLNELNRSLWQSPVNKNNPGETPINIFSKWDKRLQIAPVFAIRYGNTGFEIDSAHVNHSVLWLSPGLKLNSTIPVISPYSGVMLHVWAEFYKHSAYNLSGNTFLDNTELQLFKYHPDYSNEFYTFSRKPENGIDFDESQGGFTIYSSSFSLLFGKFKSSLGPFLRGNFPLSNTIPSIPQFDFKLHTSDHWEFTFKTGELFSDIVDDNLNWIFNGSHRKAFLKRYLVHHRLDLLFSSKFRLGFYEQVIFGGRTYPLTYINPFQLYWSAQHALGDLDNVQMGMDIDLLRDDSRFNFAFFMDEWAPFTTFDTENHHNWFAIQTGYTKIINLKNKQLYFRCEIAALSPQIYTHKFDPNVAEAIHYDYPIGYWSRGDSIDAWLMVYMQYSTKLHMQFKIENTLFGEPEYSIGKRFLKGEIKKRLKYQVEFNYKLKDYIWMDVQTGYLMTKDLYIKNNFFHFQTHFRYNISY